VDFFLEQIIYSLLIVSNPDNCSTVYYSFYCCNSSKTAVKVLCSTFIIYNKKLFYVFILIDIMFSKKELYNLIRANDNIKF